MSKNSPSGHYPFAMASRVLWQIGKYVVLIAIAWWILFNIVLYLLAWVFKTIADSAGLQGIIDILNKIIGYVTAKQIPEANGAVDGFARWVIKMKDISNMSSILWLIGIIFVLYVGTIILRHHNREQAPFINDMESKVLKFRLRFALGAGKENMYDEDEKRVRKVEKAARRRLRFMRVHIHTKKEQGEAVPTKQYTIKIPIPSNDNVDNMLQRKIKNLPVRARKESGGITFGDRETTEDSSCYLFKGSVEAKLKEAHSVKKSRKQKNKVSKGSAKNSDVVAEVKERNYTFPLKLFVDKTQAIEESKAAAQAFAERKQKDIANFLVSTDKSVTHESTHVGNTSVLYRYRTAFSKNTDTEKQAKLIENGLSDALGVEGIIVQGGASILQITLPLKEGEDDNVKYDYTIQIDVKSMIQQVSPSDPTNMILGITADNKVVHFPLSGEPHALLAGATGSGKSVTIQQIIISMMVFWTPDILKFAIVDPKRADFAFYKNNPFMIADPIQDMDEAMDFITYLTIIMEDRTKMLAHAGVRDIKGYNKWAKENGKELMHYIVLVVDEYAQLMQKHKEVQEPIKEITQMARAVGIHMIIATQTPRANILTGQIKDNVPTRIAMKVGGVTASGIILDETGAEKLKKHGDMLIKRDDVKVRAQAAFISDDEITSIFDYLKENYDKPVYPDFKAIVARANGEAEDEAAESGSTPNSTTLSLNADRKRPNDDLAKHKAKEEKSIKGTVKVSTEPSHMQRLRERAKKRKQADEKQKTGAFVNKDIEQAKTKDKPKKNSEKKQMNMDFFLGKK